jgi:multiple sugar transport system ATP-binding protein
MASISIRNLVKSYGSFTVIPDLSLEIANHEFVVFVGPSGCGKSTLLRIIAGLEPITSGELFIGDKRVNGVPAAQRDIAMVFQDYALYPHMRVYDNMAFALELRGMPKAEIDARVRQAAGMLHIEAYLDRKPKDLSGGQRQRVAMGRAIVRNPQVFLFDEPLSNLDAKLRAQVRAEIKALSQQLRTTMVFVTHDQIEAMTMADRIVVLQGGVVQQYDTPEVVYERPANQFVAGFIGSPTMNFFPVELRDDAATFSHDRAPAPLDASARARLSAASGKGVIGIRPEHFNVVSAAEASGIPVQIKLVEPLGSDTLIHFEVAGASAIARVDPSLKPKLGERLFLKPQADKLHLFDTETGRILP